VFTVKPRSEDGTHPLAIDIFFRSLAADQKNLLNVNSRRTATIRSIG
jgi:hypothetical protein